MTQPPDDVLLGLIAVQPQHGYQLLEYFRSTAALGSVWNLSQSQLYAVLKRLERGGLVLGVARASPGAPTRVEYSLTDAGQTRLHDWLFTDAASDTVEDVRIQFLSRLYVARRLNLPTVQIVRRQRQAIEARYRQQMDARAGASSGIEWLTREFELEQLQAVLRWIERCEFVPREEDEDAPPVAFF